jgi:hypothetical protein
MSSIQCTMWVNSMLLQIDLVHWQMLQPLDDKPQHTLLWSLKYSILFPVTVLHHRKPCAAFNIMHRHMKQFYVRRYTNALWSSFNRVWTCGCRPSPDQFDFPSITSFPLQSRDLASGHPFSRCTTAQSEQQVADRPWKWCFFRGYKCFYYGQSHLHTYCNDTLNGR